ncbi:MAG: hypothetical protein DVB28_000886 [Verrucomicrobia bacterium]|nr:MAG: hypothetical protein DVB28_000886 [Verrucomicrobiota bacterium]
MEEIRGSKEDAPLFLSERGWSGAVGVCGRGGRGEFQLDFETAGFAVADGDESPAGFHAAFDDGQAEADAPGLAGACAFCAEKRVAEPVEELGRDAWAAVGDGEDDVCGARMGVHSDGAGVGGVAESVAEDVGEGTLEEVGVGVDAEPGRQGGLDLVLGDVFLGEDFLEEAGEFDFFQVQFGVKACFCKLEDFLQERGHLGDFLPNIVEVGLQVGIGLLLNDSEAELHARQGRAEFVGDVPEEAFLARDKFFESITEVVEGACEAADFVTALDGDACVELAASHAFGGIAHFAQGDGDSAHERQPEQGGTEQHAADDPQRGGIEQDSAGEQRGGDEKKGGWAAETAGVISERNADADPVEVVFTEDEPEGTEGDGGLSGGVGRVGV